MKISSDQCCITMEQLSSKNHSYLLKKKFSLTKTEVIDKKLNLKLAAREADLKYN